MSTVKRTSTEKNNNTDEVKAGRYLTPFQRKLLQKSCQTPNLSEPYRQRLQIMLLADEGKSQAEICQLVACCHGTARHWILMARTGQAHNWQEQPIGRPKAVNNQYLERLKELINKTPKDYGYSFSRWTAGWLSKHLAKEFGIEVSDRHINRLLKQMGLSTRAKSLQTDKNSSFTNPGKRILIGDLSSHSNIDLKQSCHLQILTLN